jgi:hypothetical protein
MTKASEPIPKLAIEKMDHQPTSVDASPKSPGDALIDLLRTGK